MNSYCLQYETVDDTIQMCQDLGSGALIAKIDLKNASWLCPVHQKNWHLLRIHWRNQFYIDKCLPSGLK